MNGPNTSHYIIATRNKLFSVPVCGKCDIRMCFNEIIGSLVKFELEKVNQGVCLPLSGYFFFNILLVTGGSDGDKF